MRLVSAHGQGSNVTIMKEKNTRMPCPLLPCSLYSAEFFQPKIMNCLKPSSSLCMHWQAMVVSQLFSAAMHLRIRADTSIVLHKVSHSRGVLPLKESCNWTNALIILWLEIVKKGTLITGPAFFRRSAEQSQKGRDTFWDIFVAVLRVCRSVPH